MAKDTRSFNDELQARLSDPAKRLELWQQMQSASGTPTPGGMFTSVVALHLTPNETYTGANPTSLPPSSGMWLTEPFRTTMWFLLLCHHLRAPCSLDTETMPKQVAGEPSTYESDNDDPDNVALHDQDQETLFTEFNPTLRD